jgi:hypothetical protein
MLITLLLRLATGGVQLQDDVKVQREKSVYVVKSYRYQKK